MVSVFMLIDGVEYTRTEYNDRLCSITPVGGWPPLPSTKLRRALVKAKVKPICKCGATSKLDAHHIEPIKYLRTLKGHYYQDPQGNHSALNGQWLCIKCHKSLHNK